MKRRLLSLCGALALTICVASTSVIDSQASSDEPVIDGSYLTHDDESTGYDTKITRGEDLMVGYSKIVKGGPGLFYAGGSTVAAHTVNKVGLGVNIERAQKGDDRWSGFYAWQKFNYNTESVSSSKIFEVEGGYYYRVCCTHSANYDMSSSFTNGIYID